jgi:hypothetical protein
MEAPIQAPIQGVADQAGFVFDDAIMVMSAAGTIVTSEQVRALRLADQA